VRNLPTFEQAIGDGSTREIALFFAGFAALAAVPFEEQTAVAQDVVQHGDHDVSQWHSTDGGCPFIPCASFTAKLK
jgi:hypothetical protein